jgi:CheY-like chemotaxis protein
MGAVMVALRVLVVEDEGMIALALEEVLELMGHEVCGWASTEAEAVASAHQTNPDLIIVDGGLRIGSGIDAMRKILSVRFVPHVYVSGDSLIAEDLAPESVILRKPFSDDELSDAIARAMDRVPHTPSGGNPQEAAR